MDFFAVIAFVVLYHVRPQEWIGPVSTVRPAMIAMLIGLYGTLTRDKGFSFSHLFKTPHDWLMAFYLVWIVGSSSSPYETWKSCYSLFLYYFIIMLALSNIERMRKFMFWWAMMLVLVSGLAIASEYGFDPMYSYDVTHGSMKGRLVLNTSIFNNPNALGHSIVPGIAMLYFLFWWNRFFAFKFIFTFASSICGYAAFLTISKGAYVAAFATWLISYMFRRPLIVKILIVVVALTGGMAALKSMPRMSELESPRAEGGIQGRILVFTWGFQTMERNFRGVGWGKFDIAFSHAYGFLKSPHSSFVAVGTELGYTGLVLFVAILYCGFKTLMLAKTRDDEEERVRRLLFVLLVSYSVSSWMVGWASRASFFMMLAATAAFHRHLLGMNDSVPEAAPVLGSPAVAAKPEPSLSTPVSPVVSSFNSAVPAVPHTEGEPLGAVVPEARPPGLAWNSFGIWDILWIGGLTYGIIRIWSYAIHQL